MSVIFDENNNFNNRRIDENDSKLVNYLVVKRFAKNKDQANLILLSVSILFIILSSLIIYFFVFGGNFLKDTHKNPYTKVVDKYRAQGLKGKALMDKVIMDKQSGLIK